MTQDEAAREILQVLRSHNIVLEQRSEPVSIAAFTLEYDSDFEGYVAETYWTYDDGFQIDLDKHDFYHNDMTDLLDGIVSFTYLYFIGREEFEDDFRKSDDHQFYFLK